MPPCGDSVVLFVFSRVANYITQILLQPGASDLTGSFRCALYTFAITTVIQYYFQQAKISNTLHIPIDYTRKEF